MKRVTKPGGNVFSIIAVHNIGLHCEEGGHLGEGNGECCGGDQYRNEVDSAFGFFHLSHGA